MNPIKSRKQLISEVASALQMAPSEGGFCLSLTEQIVGFSAPAALVGEDCVWPHDGEEVIEILPLPSREGYGSMEEFADEQPPQIADKLYRALNGSRPFARFRAAVDILDLLDEWYAFKDKWYKEKAEEWLSDHGVDFFDGKIVATGETMIWEGEEEEDWEGGEVEDGNDL